MLTNTGEDYNTAKTKLDEYFFLTKNVTYKIFQFQQATQQAGESVKQFATRLHKLAPNCDFHDINKEITSVIVPQLSFKMHTTVCPLRKQVNT